MHQLLLVLVFLASICPGWAGTSVSYDHRAILVNGTRKLLMTGSIHYPRSSPGQWPRILQTAKEGGLDAVEVYVFWDLHEVEPGKYDFTGRKDLVRFIRAAQDAGLLVLARIGPYVCAEWNYGGIPAWARPKFIPGMVFRDENEPWKQTMASWMSYVVQLLTEEKLLASLGGPIILLQVENEYGNVEFAYPQGHEYVLWAADFATNLTRSDSVAEPPVWFMCVQEDAPDNVINTCNGFYCDNWLENYFKSRNTPGMWTEAWSGWFEQFGEPKYTRPAQDLAFSVSRWVAKGGSVSNYYMYHGGTNFGRTSGGPFLTTSYDYDAPLDEYALPSEPKFTHLKQLHAALHLVAPTVLHQDPPAAISLGLTTEAHVYEADDGSCAAFLSNFGWFDNATVTFRGNRFLLPAWSVLILQDCQTVLFNTAELSHPHDQQVFHGIGASDGAVAWEAWPEAIGIGNGSAVIHHATPLEQVDTTRDKTDYLWYQLDVTTKKTPATLSIDSADDIVYFFVDGKRQVVANMTSSSPHSVQLPIPVGEHSLQLLSATMGLLNYGPYMEQYTRGIRGSVMLDAGKNLTAAGWTHQVGLQGESSEIFSPNPVHPVAWRAFNASVDNGRPLMWFRAELPTPAGTDPVALDLSQAFTKGHAWVNGHGIGRYWDRIASGSCSPCDYRGPFSSGKCPTRCGEPTQRYYHVPRDWISAKTTNLVVILEEVGAKNPQLAQFVSVKRTRLG